MREESAAPFREVMSKLKPDVLLVLGLENWQHLPDWPYVEPVNVTDVKVEVCAFAIGSHKGVATANPHPTGSRGFDWVPYQKVL